MQHSDLRIEKIYNIFCKISKEKYTSFSKQLFEEKLEYELLNNSRILDRSSVSAALDYLTITEKLPLETISNFIHKSLDEEHRYNKPVTGFKFKNKKNCCLAPHSTLNFDSSGKMRVCCYNNTFILGTYPEVSINSAWFNIERHKFIDKLSNQIFPKGCDKCRFQAASNNISNALFTKFNPYENLISDMPIILEFECSSICNFECIMCGGKWSSSIRKNREKLSPLISPYTEAFIEELEPFLKNALVANFLGGEPFLTPLYYKIWDKILEINPEILIYVTTNGSILNNKIKTYLERLNIKIVLSLDSLQKETYEFIRKNGNFESVMSNLSELLDMKKLSAITFCPMIQNVLELPNIAKLCIANNISLHINTVTSPLGGKIKGIHEGEKYNTSVWTGKDNNIEQVSVENSTLIPEFCLHQLSSDEIQRIISILEEQTKELSANRTIFKQLRDFIFSLHQYKYKKPRPEES